MQDQVGIKSVESNRNWRWVRCEKCGGKLLRRFKDGTLEFVFGRPKGNEALGAPIQMKIVGRVRMKCFRDSCNHWNTITS